MSEPLLTVVIPTADRPEQCIAAAASVQRFERSTGLAVQLIVVEQSDTPTYEIPEWFDGEWIHTARRSVSHARNIGLDRVRGKHVIFLDDDAELCDGARTTLTIQQEQGDTVTIGQILYLGLDLDQRQTVAADISPTNLSHYFLESSAIWDVAALRSVGGFDERIGLPTKFGAEEGAELIGRLADAGPGAITFAPHPVATHPSVSSPPSDKAAAYGAGAGALIWVTPSPWMARYVAWILVRRTTGLVVATIRNDRDKRRVRFHWLRGAARGLAQGRQLRTQPMHNEQHIEFRHDESDATARPDAPPSDSSADENDAPR